jgi:hypothetical protein
MDVLASGIGEIIGGSQREERLEVLDRSMAERGIDREHYTCTATCAATARCRPPALASASGAPSPTSPASPTCTTPSRSREHQVARGIDA